MLLFRQTFAFILTNQQVPDEPAEKVASQESNVSKEPTKDDASNQKVLDIPVESNVRIESNVSQEANTDNEATEQIINEPGQNTTTDKSNLLVDTTLDGESNQHSSMPDPQILTSAVQEYNVSQENLTGAESAQQTTNDPSQTSPRIELHAPTETLKDEETNRLAKLIDHLIPRKPKPRPKKPKKLRRRIDPKRDMSARRSWEEHEKQACLQALSKHLFKGTPPEKMEILQMQEDIPSLQTRSWVQIKHFVRNHIISQKSK